MKLKKAAAVVLAAFLAAALSLPVSAKTWAADDFTLTVPEEFVYTFDQTTPEDDPGWALAGVGDPASVLSSYREMNVLASFYTEDGKTNVLVMEQESSMAKRLFNLKDASEEEKQELLDGLGEANSDQVSVTKAYQDVNGMPFYRFQVDSQIEGAQAHDVIYGTVLNGYSLIIDLYNGDKEITEEQFALQDSLVNSLQITRVLEKPEEEPANYAPMMILLGLLVIAIAAPFIYYPVKGKKNKREKDKMAERLSQYRQDHPEDDLSGEPRFLNATDCTKEAIHTFSVYHAYVKNVGALLAGVFLCALILAAAFALSAEWWLKLSAVVVAGYSAYRVFNMPSLVEKVQIKVFQRGVSSTARYAFYEEAFRVSGVQSASVYPYFQISAVRRHSHYLYLYYGPDNAYLVDQYGFEKGEFEEFEAFIREKTGK